MILTINGGSYGFEDNSSVHARTHGIDDATCHSDSTFSSQA